MENGKTNWEDVPLIEETADTLMRRNRKKYGERDAFYFDGKTISWETADELTQRIAASMIEKGIGHGTHVAFWSLNTLHLVLYLIAAMRIGAVAVVINYSYRTLELKNVLRRADVKGIFLGENKKNLDYAEMVEDVRKDCPLLADVWQMEEDFEKICDKWSPNLPLPQEIRDGLEREEARLQAQDVAVITFTSGTTREPKPVMLTHYNIINNVNQFTFRMKMNVEKGDVLMAPLPLFHCSGMSGMLYFSLVTAVPTVIERLFTAQSALEDMEKYRVTALMAVPTMLDLLIRSEHFKEYDLSSLRVVQTSGSATSPAKLRKIFQELNLECMLMGYGQTECSPLITTVLYEDDLETVTHSVGIPFPHEELRIWDLQKDREQPRGEPGEIQVRGFNTMKGYYHCEEEQKKKYTSDGWLKTTDCGYLDERGYLHFAARISENIIRHGENISAAEVEGVIEQYSENILHVRVVGVPDPVVQEEVSCLIEMKPGTTLDAEGLQGFVRAQIASFKVPKYVFVLDHLPMTATGKIDQAACKRIAAQLSGNVDSSYLPENT